MADCEASARGEQDRLLVVAREVFEEPTLEPVDRTDACDSDSAEVSIGIVFPFAKGVAALRGAGIPMAPTPGPGLLAAQSTWDGTRFTVVAYKEDSWTFGGWA